MRYLTIALTCAALILLLLVYLSLHKGPERDREIRDALDQVQQSLEQLDRRLAQPPPVASSHGSDEILAAVDSLRRDLTDNIVAAQAQIQAQQQEQPTPADPKPDSTVDDPLRDGLPRLGSNFLLPHAEPQFDAARIGGTFRTFGNTPPGLNPIIENAADVSNLHGMTNDSLCVRDGVEPMRWRGRLATSCIIEDDYTRYTFTIRPGVYWQVPRLALQDERFAWLRERVPLTAHDFVFTIAMIQHEDVQCPALKSYYEDLEEAVALDDHTLQLTWSRTLYTSLGASMGLEPLPRHVYTRDQDGQPLAEDDIPLQFNDHWFDQRRQIIGVGQYQLWDFVPDQHIILRRHADCWTNSGHFAMIDMNCRVREPEAQLTAFKNSQVHTHSLRPIQYKANILDGHERRFNREQPREGALAWERVDTLAYSYIGWNMRRPLFTDRRVRQALAHAFPKQRIIDEVFFGLGQPAVTNVHPSSDYFHDGLEDLAYDRNRAMALLHAAGWEDSTGDGILDRDIGGERISFSFVIKGYANSPEWDRTLAIYQEELRALGIVMRAETLEWRDLVKVYEDRDFDAVTGGWRMSYEVDFEQLWHSRFATEPRSSNHVGFADTEADELAERLRETFAMEERIAIARRFQEIIHREQPYLFFRTAESIFTWQNAGEHRLHGVVEALDALHPFYNRNSSWWYLER